MIAKTPGVRLHDLAHRSFQFFTQLSLTLPLSRRRADDDLKEMEFLTLAILRQHDTMIVGEIQRILGVLPAQMSRIIRSLEGRTPSLISCQINAHDKRKIDVHLTEAGARELAGYVEPRVQLIVDLLARLTDEERDSLSRLLDRLSTPIRNGAPV